MQRNLFKMSMINPDYYLHKEIFKLWNKIHNLKDIIEKQKKQIKILKLQLETINHPLKK